MKLGDLSLKELLEITSRKNKGINLVIGPFCIRLRSKNKKFIKTFQALYTNFPIPESPALVDFHIDLISPKNHRRWIKPQINFSLDQLKPFSPFSVSHTMPLFEWGFNWSIARYSQQFLMLHAAVLEKNGHCIILPALPGSGKSTLAAALSHTDWRFLSDEFCLVRPSDKQITPLPRPTPLKNQSIEIIRNFSSDAFIGPLFYNTRKGTIGHLRPPASSVAKQTKLGKAKWIIFPQYQNNATVNLQPMNKAQAIFKLATNAFNYELQGEKGFRCVVELIKSCDSYSLSYGDLDDVIVRINKLVNNG